MVKSIKLKKYLDLSYLLWILGWLALFLCACYAFSHRTPATDTWVAFACGRHHINHGVNTVDPFSFNSLKAGPSQEDIKTWPIWAQRIVDKVGLKTVQFLHPAGWINQNWLTHVIFYWLITKFGSPEKPNFDALVYWKFFIYTLTVICVYYTSRLLGSSHIISVICAFITTYICRPFFDIRPQGFTHLFTALFLLILTLVVYKNVLYIWLIVPLAVLWCNLHGGYIYLFIMLLPFLVINLFTHFVHWGFVSIGMKGIRHVLAASIVAFIVSILFNPFHLTNFTHIFVIGFSKDAKFWRNSVEWWPFFKGLFLFGSRWPFIIMCITGFSLLLIWTIIVIICLNKRTQGLKPERLQCDCLGRIDLSLIVIAILTIYMAIQGLRFVPLAAIAACPIFVLLIRQIICVISNMPILHRLNFSGLDALLQKSKLYFSIVFATTILFFSIWFCFKFKQTYLERWSGDIKFNSVFMRMSESYEMPFSACKFIKINKLKGRMFNDQFEGGFIAWCQEPRPNSGKIPLQLIFDGRAQAAYSRRSYSNANDVYCVSKIKQFLVRAYRRKEELLSDADYTEIGRCIGRELKKHNVWVILMPIYRFDSYFIKGLEHNPDWSLVFFDNKGKVFVDKTTLQGSSILSGILNGKTLYPDEFSGNLTKAHILFKSGRGEALEQEALDYAIKAFSANPSRIPIEEIITYAATFSALKYRVKSFCKGYIDDFARNKELFVKQNSYIDRIEAAISALSYLKTLAQQNKHKQSFLHYQDRIREYEEELAHLRKKIAW